MNATIEYSEKLNVKMFVTKLHDKRGFSEPIVMIQPVILVSEEYLNENEMARIQKDIIEKFDSLKTKGIEIKEIYRVRNDNLKIYHVFTGEPFNLKWYKHFTNIEVYIMDNYTEKIIDFRYFPLSCRNNMDMSHHKRIY